MDRLPKKHEELLKELLPHDREGGYLKIRLASLDGEKAIEEHFLLMELDELGYIRLTRDKDGNLSGTDVTVRSEDPSLVDSGLAVSPVIDLHVTQPHGFFARAKGLVYFEERRRERFRSALAIILAALLGGFFAWGFLKLFPV